MEEMQCIKVSNEDNLYITNDYIVTHNTSTTSVLTKELCNKGMESTYYGSNMNEVKSGMLKAQKWITNYISKNSIQIDGDLEKIRKVATISANNDPEIGDLIVSCMEKVGVDGVITSDFSSGLDTTIEVTTGLKIERGWASPQYVTSPEEGICVMEEPYILVAGERVSSVSQIMNLMGVIAKSGRP
jgi:chaperonin GroEL